MGLWLTLPTVLLAVGAIIGGAIVGFFYFIGVFGKQKASDIKTAKEASDFVIQALQGKIEILEGKVNDQADALDSLSKRLDLLLSENRTLREVLEGKDGQSLEIQQESMKAIQTIAALMKNTQNIQSDIKQILEIIKNREVVVTKIHNQMEATAERMENAQAKT